MARAAPQLPPSLQGITADDMGVYGQFRRIQDESYRVRTLVKSWKDQQAQDRALRERYARRLLAALLVQAAVVNAAFFLLAAGALRVEPATAQAFILAVFAEAAALVLFVVKYLFRPPDDRLLRSLGRAGRRLE